MPALTQMQTLVTRGSCGIGAGIVKTLAERGRRPITALPIGDKWLAFKITIGPRQQKGIALAC